MSEESRVGVGDSALQLSRRRLLEVGGLGGVGLLVAACGGDGSGEGSGDQPEVRMQALDGGMGALSLKVISEEGFDRKHGFRGSFQYIPADASAQHFLQHESDVSFDLGPPDVAVMNNKGNDVVMFSGNVKGFVRVIAPADAPYESIEDLAGKKVGHYGDDSTGTLTISMLLEQYHRVDFSKDFDLVQASPPALVPLLAKKQVDAIVDFQPHIARASTTIDGGVKTLFDPAADWHKHTGGQLWTTTISAFRNWVTKHPRLAKSVLASWRDGAKFINAQPDKIIANEAYHDLLGLDQAGLKAFGKFLGGRERVAAGFTPQNISNINKFLELMAKQGVLFSKAPQHAAQTLDLLVK